MIKLCIDCKIKKAAKNRNICYTCKHKRWRKKHPYEYVYNNLKIHAKSRNKEFSLTLEEFKEFAIKCDYINKKGIYKNSYHIDRIRENEGYHKNNIQLLTNIENVKKYIEFKYIDENCNKIFKTSNTITNNNNNNNTNDCPF